MFDRIKARFAALRTSPWIIAVVAMLLVGSFLPIFPNPVTGETENAWPAIVGFGLTAVKAVCGLLLGHFFARRVGRLNLSEVGVTWVRNSAEPLSSAPHELPYDSVPAELRTAQSWKAPNGETYTRFIDWRARAIAGGCYLVACALLALAFARGF